jgi:uncharacterized protein YjlB
MSLVENVKKTAERVTGWQRPGREQLASLVRKRKPVAVRFRDDGLVPNNPYWPLLIYRGAVRLPKSLDPAAIFEDVFASNSWGDSWRNGVYDYVHYHSRIHEVLGVARGKAKLHLGGVKGRAFTVKAGDTIVLPAGTGHQCLSASKDFLVVGAYPPQGTYDECHANVEEHKRGSANVKKVGRPRKDPLFGAEGGLLKVWKPKR